MALFDNVQPPPEGFARLIIVEGGERLGLTSLAI
jgi:hypothetical protein